MRRAWKHYLLLDTNIIINHLGRKIEYPLPAQSLALSVLSLFELLRYPGMTQNEENALREVIETCTFLEISRTIAEHAAELGRTRNIGAVDLLIAATALEYDIPLITKNLRDFKKIPGLRVQDHF